MARKLSLQERESINYITDVLCHALPAAQRSFAGSLASALVRVKGEQITDADLERATEKFGEYQSALIEVAKAKVLDRVPAVDAEGDGEAFTLRVPEGLGEEAGTSGEAASASAEGASDGGATGEKDGAAAEEPPAEKKPARRRRTRRKKVAELEAAGDAAEAAGDAAAAEAAPAAEAEVAAEPEPEAEAKKKSVRPGRGARAARAKAKAEAAEKAEKSAKASGDEKPAGTAAKPAKARKSAKDAGDEKSAAKAAGAQKAALPAAKEAPALPEAAAAAASEPEAVSGSAADAAGAAAPDQASAPAKEAPKKRTRRRRTKKPVEDIVVKGAAAEEFLAKESDAVEAEAGAVANELQAEALLAEKGDAAEATPEVEAAATAEEAVAPEAVAEDAPVVEDATVAPADAPAEEARTDGRSGGRARVRGRGRRGLERRPRGDSLSDVPYVRRGGESETALREQIVQLDPRLWMNGWLLSHPGAFTLYERELRGIDAALQKGELPGDLTRRQLAYKMGGNEKFFEYGSDGHKLLRAMGADDLIGHRLTPKADMLYHVPRRRKNMKILVTENLDPWLDVRDLMYEDGRSLILGERVHGVVLGGGNPVIENNRLAGMLETLGAETVEVLYWGDIDRAGLNLLQRLTAMLEGRYKVTPFMPAYRLMLDRAMERWPDPDQNERTTQENVEVQDFSSMLEGLTDEQAAYFSSIIQKCGLIPQEILTKQDL